MKCMEKERTRRYKTADALAEDVRAFLNTDPVEARPPSKVYLIGKWVRRNKLAFAAAGAVVLALLAGVVVSAWQALRSVRAATETKMTLASSDFLQAVR